MLWIGRPRSVLPAGLRLGWGNRGVGRSLAIPVCRAGRSPSTLPPKGRYGDASSRAIARLVNSLFAQEEPVKWSIIALLYGGISP